MRKEIIMEKARIIRHLIDESGLSVKEFAARASIPYTTLRSILERGIGNASVNNVIKICKALGITIEQLENFAYEEAGINVVTIAAHHDGETWTDEELQEIENFKQFVLSKRSQ